MVQKTVGVTYNAQLALPPSHGWTPLLGDANGVGNGYPNST